MKIKTLVRIHISYALSSAVDCVGEDAYKFFENHSPKRYVNTEAVAPKVHPLTISTRLKSILLPLKKDIPNRNTKNVTNVTGWLDNLQFSAPWLCAC